MSMNDSASPDEETCIFLWETHQYVNEYIRFADTKAVFIAGASTALIGTLVGSSSLDSCLKTTQWSVLQLLALSGAALLIISTILSLIAIKPRHGYSSKIGFIYWGAIVGHKDSMQFSHQIRALSVAERAVALSEHLFTLATIATRKYKYVDWATFAGIFGGAISGIVLFIQHAIR